MRLIYVFLQSADLNVARVRQRVMKGGHDVPEPSIRDRRRRSFTSSPGSSPRPTRPRSTTTPAPSRGWW